MVPGSSWIRYMQDGVSGAERTIALLSEAYTSSVYGAAEWQTAWRDDPLSTERKLLVLRVEDCARPGLLAAVGSVDLFDISANEARQLLQQTVRIVTDGRLKPSTAPDFPGHLSRHEVASEQIFPGISTTSSSTEITRNTITPQSIGPHMQRFHVLSEESKHVFVSYVREDIAQVDQLCALLNVAQIPYWRDRTSLAPGDQWKEKVRSAIRSGTIVFLACFSSQSRAKAKSYMNEEISLAVKEFRKLPPAVTWLIPVRFDDGDIPEWNLGAGRTLGDLNYADLHGEKYAIEATKLTTAINRIIWSRLGF